MTDLRGFEVRPSGKLTPLGAAVHEAYRWMQRRPASEIRPGHFVWADGWQYGWRQVLRVEPVGERLRIVLELRTRHDKEEGNVLLVRPEDEVRSVRDEAHRLALLETALAIQRAKKSSSFRLTVTGNAMQNEASEPGGQP